MVLLSCSNLLCRSAAAPSFLLFQILLLKLLLVFFVPIFTFFFLCYQSRKDDAFFLVLSLLLENAYYSLDLHGPFLEGDYYWLGCYCSIIFKSTRELVGRRRVFESLRPFAISKTIVGNGVNAQWRVQTWKLAKFTYVY